VKIDAGNNEIIIGDDDDLFSGKMMIGEFNWITKPTDKKTFPAKVKIRSASPPADCKVEIIDDKIKILFDNPQRAVTPGQAAVIYIEKEVIGGGFICSGLPDK